MPTYTNEETMLIINRGLTRDQFNAAVADGTITANELTFIPDNEPGSTLDEKIPKLVIEVYCKTIQAPFERHYGSVYTGENFYTIDWGDGSPTEDFSTFGVIPTHEYAVAGLYRITATQQEGYNKIAWLSSFSFGSTWDEDKVHQRSFLRRIIEFPEDKRCLCGDITTVSDGFCSDLFKDCINLTDIGNFNIPDNIVEAGYSFCLGLFENTPKLQFINDFQLPSKLERVEREAFYNLFLNSGIRSLDNLRMPPRLTTVGDSFCCKCFAGSKIEDTGNFTMSKYIMEVGDKCMEEMFKDCTELISLNNFQLPQHITTINGDYCFKNMFSGCVRLPSINLSFPYKVEKVNSEFGAYMFSGCTNLTSIGMLTQVTSITSSTPAYRGMFTGTAVPVDETKFPASAWQE